MPNPTQTGTRGKRRRKLSRKRLALVIAISFVIIVFGIISGIVINAIAKTPEFDPKSLVNANQSSFIYDKNGVQIGVLYAKENRQIIDSNHIPKLMKEAIVNVEDIRFYQHHGVDPIGIARSFVHDLTGSKLQGGSTITIQLARKAFLSPEQTLTRKIQEAYLAVQIERRYTKDEILTMYLNRIYYGESANGIEAAAKTYFGKDLAKGDKLDVAEVALLAGLPQAPSAYDPYANPDAAKYRRTVVLGVLRDNKVISQADYDKYKDEPFTYVDQMKKQNKNPQAVNQPTVQLSYKFPYFVDYVVHELQTNYNISQDAIYSGGLKIYTTVDSRIQSAAEAAFADSNNFPADKDGAEVEGAMVVEDPKTGAIVTMVGGRNYSSSQSFNRAWQAERQPGSTIKPLVVMSPALAKGGYFTGTVFDDMPVTYSNNGQPWKPTDDDTAERGWRGLITMREALIHSVNVYAIKLLNDEGIDYAWNFGKNNFDLPLKQKSKNLTLALGTAEIPVVDMVQAYSAFPNNGMMATAHSVLKVIDDKGTVIVDNTNVSKKRAVSPQVAFSINDMLRSVVSDPGGTGIAAQMGNWAVAGKTGTTSLEDNKQNVGMRDAWFMGYTPDYVGGVWMGFDQSTTSRNLVDVFGGGPPARLWKQIMTIAHQNLPVVTSFDQPDGVTKITFDSKSGKTPSHLTPSRFIKSDWAIVGALPTGVSNVWYQKTVCAATGLLPGPNTVSTVTKTFLNVDRQGVYASWPWDEAQYRAPWKVCDMGLGGQSSKQPPGQTKPKKPASPASSSPASPASPTQPNVPATQPPNTTSPNSTGSPKTR